MGGSLFSDGVEGRAKSDPMELRAPDGLLSSTSRGQELLLPIGGRGDLASFGSFFFCMTLDIGVSFCA